MNSHNLEHPKPTTIIGMKTVTGADVIQLPGGSGGAFIVRSTARKDRHSKVFTAKGLRDRRVRLSAHTAIQFYDVQDRLGYDRPSKAVDWLIQKAKSAIDNLSHLPNPYIAHPSAPTESDPKGIESGFNDFLFHTQLGENLTPPPPPMGSAGQDLALSLQTQNYAVDSGNSGFEFDKIVAWTGNVFGSNPVFNQSSVASPPRGSLQSSLESPVPHYAWNDLSVAVAGKRHPIPTHEHSSLSSTPHFVSGGLPHLDVHGRFQNDGDAGKVPFLSSSFSRR